jgi:hypothetical protein
VFIVIALVTLTLSALAVLVVDDRLRRKRYLREGGDD